MSPPTDPRIRRALETALTRGEVGVQVAAYLGDRLIVDAGIGTADEAGRGVEDAIFPIFSVTKAVLATAIHMQAERGLLDIDAPIASYWPEYGVNGKAAITPRHVLTHRAGVPQMPPTITPERLKDWDWITGELANMTPLEPAGARSTYHAISYGYLLGEVLRRTDPEGRMPCEFFRREIFAPLGVDDFWVGLPAAEEPRVARLTWGAAGPGAQIPRTPLREAMMPSAIDVRPSIYNLPQVHQACIPASGGIGSARGVARFFSLLANRGAVSGRVLVSEARLRACLQPRPNSDEVDSGIGIPVSIGVAGYQLSGRRPGADPLLGGSTAILAHGGAGGSLGWADLDSGLSVAITHNRMFGAVNPEHHPFGPLADAVRQVAAEL